MNDQIRQLLAQITRLEDELRTMLHEQGSLVCFQIKGRRVEFEESIAQAHSRLKRGFFLWLITNRPQNLITGPIIYSMIVPLLTLDFFVSIYQAICFPIYRITKVRRADYIVFDRQHLRYLNFIEKFHCTYCAYANGLLAYIVEIVARTEQYFCPIKHARRIVGTHTHYDQFLSYGEAADYQLRLEEFRIALEKMKRMEDDRASAFEMGAGAELAEQSPSWCNNEGKDE